MKDHWLNQFDFHSDNKLNYSYNVFQKDNQYPADVLWQPMRQRKELEFFHNPSWQSASAFQDENQCPRDSNQANTTINAISIDVNIKSSL